MGEVGWWGQGGVGLLRDNGSLRVLGVIQQRVTVQPIIYSPMLKDSANVKDISHVNDRKSAKCLIYFLNPRHMPNSFLLVENRTDNVCTFYGHLFAHIKSLQSSV